MIYSKENQWRFFFNWTVCAFSYWSVSQAQEGRPWYPISVYIFWKVYHNSEKKLINSPKFNQNQKALYHPTPKILWNYKKVSNFALINWLVPSSLKPFQCLVACSIAMASAESFAIDEIDNRVRYNVITRPCMSLVLFNIFCIYIVFSIFLIFHLLNDDRWSLVRDSPGHCVDSLSKTLLYNLLSTGSTKEDIETEVIPTW